MHDASTVDSACDAFSGITDFLKRPTQGFLLVNCLVGYLQNTLDAKPAAYLLWTVILRDQGADEGDILRLESTQVAVYLSADSGLVDYEITRLRDYEPRPPWRRVKIFEAYAPVSRLPTPLVDRLLLVHVERAFERHALEGRVKVAHHESREALQGPGRISNSHTITNAEYFSCLIHTLAVLQSCRPQTIPPHRLVYGAG